MITNFLGVIMVLWLCTTTFIFRRCILKYLGGKYDINNLLSNFQQKTFIHMYVHLTGLVLVRKLSILLQMCLLIVVQP